MSILNILLGKRNFSKNDLERAIERSRCRHRLLAGPTDKSKMREYRTFLYDYIKENPQELYENAILACQAKYPSWWNSRN
jgi:hypothetical protein